MLTKISSCLSWFQIKTAVVDNLSLVDFPIRAKLLVLDNNDEEQMEINNENENVLELLTNESDQQWHTHHWLKTRNIGITKYTAADLQLMKDSLLITCVTKKLCLAKLVVFYRIPFRVLAKSTEIQK
ncbi:hypothetical protein T10_10783 [Trichinella papuae]|uniref:Uncharacterized protein n=1 Tax=Trichinella papuae TaxID=268474 RepID=A0A0V1MFC9_9BILA|nr:hypothetical protein T10_10783 [Trichinella papuae]